MRKVINEVAELIRDLETLKQVRADSVESLLDIRDGKQIFEVKFSVQESGVEACIKMLEEVKKQNDIGGSFSAYKQGVYIKRITAIFVK